MEKNKTKTKQKLTNLIIVWSWKKFSICCKTRRQIQHVQKQLTMLRRYACHNGSPLWYVLRLIGFDWYGKPYSPEKWLYNRIYCPSNRSKQIKETHTAYSAGTQYTRQSLNEKQHTWLHRQTLIGYEAMYVVFHSNFAAYIVCRRYTRFSHYRVAPGDRIRRPEQPNWKRG